ncbi:hypothetical protein Q1695_016298 [Nippostrongylus brasiliensis]|nr:hypothetical protein Q1695_016298 [Nippostrongylus brasiliensis]
MRFTAVRFLIVAAAAAMSIIVIMQVMGTMSNHSSQPPSSTRKAFDNFRQCMLTQLEKVDKNPENIFKGFSKLTSYCTSTTDVNKVKMVPLENKDEVKYYVMSPKTTDPSVVVSLGIGADVQAEKHLKNILPKGSEFFGADPVIQPNADLFGKVGTFFPFAVSEHIGVTNAHIRLNNNSYKTVPVVHIDAETFFTKMINRTHIDHLIIDNEGPEYEMIPMLAIDDILADAGMAICHMNVEFHMPGPSTRYKQFVDVMTGVLETGRFAPIYNVNYGHQRMFLVNYEDPYCSRKYLDQFFDVSPKL